MSIPSSERLFHSPRMTFRRVKERILVVNTATNKFFCFNSTGASILSCFAEGSSIDGAYAALRGLIPTEVVDDAELSADVCDFAELLVEQQLILREGEAQPGRNALRLADWRDEMDAVGSELQVPVWAKLEISTRCHLDCAHCYIPFAERAPKGPLRVFRAESELTDEEITGAMDQLADLGTLLLTVTGGEIFVRSTVLDLLRHAHGRGFILELFTSGTLLTEQKADALAELNIGRIQISVYGADPEKHDAFTRREGSWARSIEATRMLVERGLAVELVCSITPSNYLDVLRIRELAESLGASCSYGYPITARTNGDRDTHAHRLSREQLRTSILTLPDFFAMPRAKAPETRICPAGVNMCSIGATGEVYSCSQFMQAAGNIRTQRLDDIWNESPVLERIRSFRTQDLKPSRNGKLAAYVGLCPGLNLLEEGDPMIPASITAETTLAVAEILAESGTDPYVREQLLNPEQGSMRPESL